MRTRKMSVKNRGRCVDEQSMPSPFTHSGRLPFCKNLLVTLIAVSSVVALPGFADAAPKTATASKATAATGVAPPRAGPFVSATAGLPDSATLVPVSVNGVPTLTYIAAARQRKTPIYATKGGLKPDVIMDNQTNFSGRHVFEVLGREGDWLHVRVPIRPQNRMGWVKSTDVTLYQHDFGIVVTLSQHRLVVYKSGKEVMRETVAVGQSKYPTPTGSFFIRELARPANPRGAYGPWAFGLSAYSNVLTKFGRGDGQVGIHGTNLPKQLGTDVSHGCIRVSNAGIIKMAQTLPQGVPVEIRS